MDNMQRRVGDIPKASVACYLPWDLAWFIKPQPSVEAHHVCQLKEQKKEPPLPIDFFLQGIITTYKAFEHSSSSKLQAEAELKVIS